MQTNQSSETASTIQTHSKQEWIMILVGVTISSLSSTMTQVGAEYLLLDCGAQLHASPIKYPGQRMSLLEPGFHTASGVRLQHDGGRLERFHFQEEEQPECFFMRAMFNKPLVVSLSKSIGMIF